MSREDVEGKRGYQISYIYFGAARNVPLFIILENVFHISL